MTVHDRVFKSGKFAGQTYGDVWKVNPGFFRFMAEKSDYWDEILNELSGVSESISDEDEGAPPVELVRKYYKTVPIHGFDMSDHIVSIYEKIRTDRHRMEYLRSVERRRISVK